MNGKAAVSISITLLLSFLYVAPYAPPAAAHTGPPYTGLGATQPLSASWDGLETGWTMFHGGSGANGSYSGNFPWSHFEVAWESSYANTSYSIENTGPVAPQASPVVFNGTIYLMDSTSPVLIAINSSTGIQVQAVNLGSLSGQTAASVDSTPLIGVFGGAPYLTESTNRANTHETYAVNLFSWAASYCHSGQPVSVGAAPIPGGFVQPTKPWLGNPGGVFVFNSWALGNNNANCLGVETTTGTSAFNDTPSVGLTYSPASPTNPDATYFLSDQTTGAVDAFPTDGGAMKWADPLLAPAYGSLALTNTTYGIGGGGSVSAPLGFVADDNGTTGPSHLYAVDVNCGTLNCFSAGNASNTLPGGIFNLSSTSYPSEDGVNSTVALRTLSPVSTQVLYAARNGTLGGVTATLSGASPAGPNSTGGYALAWTPDWEFPTGANFSASPATANGLVMDGNQAGMFYILNATTGALVWQHQFPGAIYSSPAIYNGHIYVLTSSGTLAEIGPSPPLVSAQVSAVVTDGWQAQVNVTVNATGPLGNSAGPLSGSTVTLWVTGGAYVGAQNLGRLVTPSNGSVSFPWTPPVSATNYSYNFTAFVNATGYSMGNATASTVAVPPSALLVTSMTAAPSILPQGQITSINVSVVGGFLPYTFSYSGLPSGCSSMNVSSLPCTPTVPGNFTIDVVVTDALSHSATSSTPLEVLASALPVIVSFSATPNPVAAGNRSILTVVASGGTAPYSYSYTGLPTGCPSENLSMLSCTPDAKGNYTVTVTVTDSKGHTAQRTLALKVTSGPGGSSPSENGGSLSSPFLWLLLLLIVAGVAIGLILLFKRRKRKAPYGSTSGSGPSAGIAGLGAGAAAGVESVAPSTERGSEWDEGVPDETPLPPKVADTGPAESPKADEATEGEEKEPSHDAEEVAQTPEEAPAISEDARVEPPT